jgi:hypothetical protein
MQEYLESDNGTSLHFPTLFYFTDAPSEIWIDQFVELNKDWWTEILPRIREQTIEGLNESWDGYQNNSSHDEILARWYLTRFRFFSSKLTTLGFGETIETIFSALQEPGILRNPRWIVESMISQGFALRFLDLLSSYNERNLKGDSYIRAVLARAIRFLSSDFQRDYTLPIGEFLINEVFKGTIAEKLMATETLVLIDRFPRISYCDFIELFALEETRVYPQLYRNLLILLKMYCEKAIPIDEQLQPWNEETIHFAYRVDEELLTILKKHQEHPETRNYYSHQYPDIDDQSGPYP